MPSTYKIRENGRPKLISENEDNDKEKSSDNSKGRERPTAELRRLSANRATKGKVVDGWGSHGVGVLKRQAKCRVASWHGMQG